MSRNSKYFASVVLGIVLLSCKAARSQETTTTNCSLSGNTANCTSNTTDYGAQQQRAYEQGQQVGNALGKGLAAAMQAHQFTKGLRKYCDAHPGQDWHYYSRVDGHTISQGHCPTQTDEALTAANEFMSRHKDYIPCPTNSAAITAYVDGHNLNPRERGSYERAFKDLKKTNQLKLYAN